MRVYGTSPLFNYVELIFRCKKMFIIAIVLGTVVMSTVVYMRKDTYEASMLIALTGNTVSSDAMGSLSEQSRKEQFGAAARKATRLKTLWLEEDPKFLEEAMAAKGFDTRWGAEFKSKVAQVRNKISVGSELLGGQYLKVTINWGDSQEAEAILDGVYAKFSRRTVDLETSLVTMKRNNLEELLKKYNAEADKYSKKKIEYITKHYKENPVFMNSMLGRVDQAQTVINEYSLLLDEAKTRLASVSEQLKSTKPTIVTSNQRNTSTVDSTSGLKASKQDLESQREQLLTRFSPQHPQVVDLDKRIAIIQKQLDDNGSKPQPKVDSGETTITAPNPLFNDLKKQEQQLNLAVVGITRKIASARTIVARDNDALKRMPELEKEWEQVNRAAVVADNVRNTLDAQLRAATIDEERNKMTEALLVKQEIPPRAEKVNGGGKGLMLYLVGPILGIFIAFCFSLLAETLDHTLRTPVEVERHLGKPVLAVIPKMKSGKPSRRQLGGANRQSIGS
jgi:capsular polysaccharide biosynthesis protein